VVPGRLSGALSTWTNMGRKTGIWSKLMKEDFYSLKK
jgi:hypothetical protein